MDALTYLFLITATAGGVVLLCQFGMLLFGLGHGHGDFHGDSGPHDFSGDAHGGHGDGHGHDAHSDQHESNLSNWLFSVITFRTVVAASTFFGLAGLAAQSAGTRISTQLLVASAAGIAAMYAVHWIMRSISRLGVDGTARIQTTVGREAVVYIPIPAAKARAGKVQVKMPSGLCEYEAVTAGDERLPTGARVRIVGLEGTVLRVELVHEHEPQQTTA